MDKIDWKLHPSYLRWLKQNMGPTGDGPICDSSVQSTFKVFLLETRPTGRGNRCLQPEVESPEGVRKSSMTESLIMQESTSSWYSCDSLEKTIRVPSFTKDAVWLFQTTPSYPQLDSVEVRPESLGSTAPFGHVAYLRKKFGYANLSSNDKELFLSSWRSTTSLSYVFHF